MAVVTALVAAISGLYGLVIGSFLNVVIWRVPRQGVDRQAAVALPGLRREDREPRQHPGRLVAAAPRHAAATAERTISARYPLIELFTAVLFVAVGARFAHSWALPAYLVLGAALVALSAIDLEHYFLPNRILYPVDGALLVLLAGASALEHDWGAYLRALVAGAVAFAIFYRDPLRLAPGYGLRRRAALVPARARARLAGLGRGRRWPLRRVPVRRGRRGRADRGQGQGPQAADPVRAVPRGRRDDLRARSASRSSTGTAASAARSSAIRPLYPNRRPQRARSCRFWLQRDGVVVDCCR